MRSKDIPPILLAVCLGAVAIFYSSCSSEHKNTPAVFQANLNKVGLPVEKTTTLPADIAPFQFDWHKFIWAPFAEDQKTGLTTSAGWGYMSPMVVVDGASHYAPLFFSCDADRKNFYCIYLMKDGQVVSELHGMGLQLLPPGHLGKESYQPPMLFKHGNELLMIYELATTTNRSIINMVAVDVTGPTPYTWYRKASFVHSGRLNYLGGTMAPTGEIFIAGAGGTEKARSPTLELLHINPPYSDWGNSRVLAEFTSHARAPLYPHLQVRNSGELEILYTLHNGTPCDEDGQIYSQSYKATINIIGTFNGPFVEQWRDEASDVTGPDPDGDSCLFHKQRYPISQLYDESTNTVYSILRSSEIAPADLDPDDRVGSNDRGTWEYKLYANGALVVPDLSDVFGAYFTDSTAIWSMTLTQLATKEFVIFATNDGRVPSKPDINIVTTSDFTTYSNVYRLATTESVGHSVHVGQANKNGSTSINALHFFFPGTVHGDKNLQHRYHFYKATVQ